MLIGKAAGISEEEANVPIPEAVEAGVRAGLSRMDAMKAVARDRGLSKRDVYRAMEERAE